MTWRLVLVLVGFVVQSHKADTVGVTLIADMMSLIGSVLELFVKNVGGISEGLQGAYSEDLGIGCTLRASPTFCDYSVATASCTGIFKCGICTKGDPKEKDALCTIACIQVKNESFQNGNGGFKAKCSSKTDLCQCKIPA